ncbi:MAG: hypothetical protein JOZ32_08470 [Bryobacterales bacterium]|nr:hypothetical protein [Bryobacterales bacterium]
MLMVDEELGRVAELAAFELPALFLDVTELIESLLELPGEALAVQAERGEGAVGIHDIEVLVGRIGGAGEQLGFEEGNTVETPGRIGHFMDELGFGGGGRFVFIEELLDMKLESGRVFGGENGSAGGQAMT